jgi:hypothetical protein
VTARAHGSPLPRVPYLGAVWRIPPMLGWGATFAFLRRRGRLLAVDRHAVMTLDPPGWSRLEVARACVAGGVIVGLAYSTVVGVPAYAVALLGYPNAAKLFLAVASWLLSVSLGVWCIEFGVLAVHVVGRRGRTARAAADLAVDGHEVYIAGMAAAWPRGQGHFARLRDVAVAAARDARITVVADARDEQAAAIYRRAGFAPIYTDDQLLLAFPPVALGVPLGSRRPRLAAAR